MCPVSMALGDDGQAETLCRTLLGSFQKLPKNNASCGLSALGRALVAAVGLAYEGQVPWTSRTGCVATRRWCAGYRSS